MLHTHDLKQLLRSSANLANPLSLRKNRKASSPSWCSSAISTPPPSLATCFAIKQLSVHLILLSHQSRLNHLDLFLTNIVHYVLFFSNLPPRHTTPQLWKSFFLSLLMIMDSRLTSNASKIYITFLELFSRTSNLRRFTNTFRISSVGCLVLLAIERLSVRIK